MHEVLKGLELILNGTHQGELHKGTVEIVPMTRHFEVAISIEMVGQKTQTQLKGDQADASR